MICVAGPRGSGKTTALVALAKARRGTIICANLNQVQNLRELGCSDLVTWASFRRSDPDESKEFYVDNFDQLVASDVRAQKMVEQFGELGALIRLGHGHIKGYSVTR